LCIEFNVRDKNLKRVEVPQKQAKRKFYSFFLFSYLLNNAVGSLDYTA